jgi:hypothetical protein
MRTVSGDQVKLLTVVVALLALPMVASGEGAAPSADELAKQLANPVASLTSVPFQLNWDTGIGASGDGERETLNVQPVIPFTLNDDWNLISRTILPVVWQQDVVPGDGSQSGLGDTVQSVFFSPSKPTAGGWILGGGPVLLLPTGADDFTVDQWGAGPTGVALKQTESGWTYGILFNHLWGFSNSGRLDDVNATFLQPFAANNIGRGRTVSFNTESTYDWNASQWTVPVNVSFSQVLPIHGQLTSFQFGARAYLDKPDGGPDWGLRFVFTMLFPR